VIFPLRVLRGSSDRNSYIEALLQFSLYILPIPQLASLLTRPPSQKFAVDIGLFLEDLAPLAPLFPRIESQITLHFDAYLRLLRLLSMILNHLPEPIGTHMRALSGWIWSFLGDHFNDDPHLCISFVIVASVFLDVNTQG